MEVKRTMHNYTFYTVLTVVYAILMLAVFIFSTRQIDKLDDEDMDEEYYPVNPTKKAGKMMLVIWACYTIQMVLLMLFDLTGR